jgi:hypothetical protein
MQYVEFLRARKVVVSYAICVLGVAAAAAIAALILPPHAVMVAGDKTDTSVHQGMVDLSLMGLWVGSALLAAIVATILGGSLASENRGHLELAWTKPVSRLRYAASKMLVDVGAIFAVQVFTFVVILALDLIHIRSAVNFRIGQADLVDAIRFALFPLAWYALLQGLTASLREQAGVAQGLIWPIALGLTGVKQAPLGPVWTGILGFVNLINPFNYAHYAATSGMTTIQVMGAEQAGILGVLGLATVIALGSFGALVQWKRLEA